MVTPLEIEKNGLNDTFSAYPTDKCLSYFLQASASMYPSRNAVTFKGTTLSYQSLIAKVNQFANLLIARGIQKGDVVGLALDRSAEMIISLLAILTAGAAYVPLDPEYPKDRIEFMLHDSGAKLLLTQKKYKSHFQSSAPEMLIEEVLFALNEFKTIAPDFVSGGQDLAYILYTSGSTGKPKGVQIRHFSLVNFLLSMQKKPGLTMLDKVLAVTTISFDIAGLDIYLPLITGAELVLLDSSTAKDGQLLLEMVKNEQITMMQATPYTWRMMLEAGWDQRLLLKIICGGEALPNNF